MVRLDRSTHEDQRQQSFCRCVFVELSTFCWMLIGADGDHCRRRGWYSQRGIQVACGQTTTGASAMRLYSPLVAGREASVRPHPHQQQCRTKFCSFDKVETNWTCSICFDIVEGTKFRPTLLPKTATLLPKTATMSKQHSTLQKESFNL